MGKSKSNESDDPQKDFSAVENRQVEQQAMNPAVTNEKGERQDEGDPGSKRDSADADK